MLNSVVIYGLSTVNSTRMQHVISSDDDRSVDKKGMSSGVVHLKCGDLI
jgi:hypothetical protein